MIRFGSAMLHIGFPRHFGYQHIGIGNVKSSWYRPTRGHNTNAFAFWWNIALAIPGHGDRQKERDVISLRNAQQNTDFYAHIPLKNGTQRQ